ncbi:MAG: hypothetical protein HOP29_11110 [Phycisphaerales bacterium]|nr:hypothetical protein [Phycisphaerales bacterium]
MLVGGCRVAAKLDYSGVLEPDEKLLNAIFPRGAAQAARAAGASVNPAAAASDASAAPAPPMAGIRGPDASENRLVRCDLTAPAGGRAGSWSPFECPPPRPLGKEPRRNETDTLK